MRAEVLTQVWSVWKRILETEWKSKWPEGRDTYYRVEAPLPQTVRIVNYMEKYSGN